MSIIEKLKDSALGLKGADISKRDGKALDTLKATVQTTPLSMKGKTPTPSYEDHINDIEINSEFNSEN